MAEKRKLLAEIEKVFKKIDEGVEIFEETMSKMHEANSENQREKFQDDLKKEIKKLQRLRDQVKNWQNSSEIKDKEKLTQYRKVIEQRMEQFKDVERENKTKPHSKQGLIAEEKMDPKDRQRYEMIEWISNSIRGLGDESDKVEAQLEALSSGDSGRRRNKQKEKSRDAEKEKEMRETLENIKFHIDKLEICMRLVDNESLDPEQLTHVKDQIEMYLDFLNGSDCEADLSDLYDDLQLTSLTGICTKHSGSVDDERNENGVESCNGLSEEQPKSRHSSADTSSAPPSMAAVKRSTSVASSTASLPATPLKLSSQPSVECGVSSPPAPPTPPPPPPGIPYNSVAAGAARAAAAAAAACPSSPAAVQASQQIVKRATVATAPSGVSVVGVSSWGPSGTASAPAGPGVVGDEKRPSAVDGELPPAPLPLSLPAEYPAPFVASLEKTAVADTRNPSLAASPAKSLSGSDIVMGDDLRNLSLSLRFSQPPQETKNAEPQTAFIPPQLGASPLGRAPQTHDHDAHIAALEHGVQRLPLQMDSERPRSYLPKMACSTPTYYPQQPPLNADSMEYYLRLSPETLFFTFYYMEGSRAQLLAAKALKKLSWRFHTKYLMWFQRHEEPKQITDDFEEGTYVYFDFEKWAQRKKEQFRFEYRFLEDKELD